MRRFSKPVSLMLLTAIALTGCDMASLTSSSPLTSFAGGSSLTDNKQSTGAAKPPEDGAGLRAGTVDDNARFTEFLGYQRNYHGEPMRLLDVSERYVIKVVDADGHAVSNAEVTVAAGDKTVFTGRSYADGQLLFHPRALGLDDATKTFAVTGTKGTNTISGNFSRGQEGVWQLKLTKPEARPAPRLEVLFMLDATGSMGGEIDQLQKTIDAISNRIHALPNQPNVKFGLIAYRDRDDDQVIANKMDLTADLSAFKTALNGVSAGGGGDYPEDMETALAQGVTNISWSGEDTLRLTFLVADAPPHIDYPQSTAYTTSVKNAAGKGIKYFPVGCSGLEPEGEYVMRQLAQYTMGQFLFITRGGDEETGGGAVSHNVDKFQEGQLDDLVVDIVKGELDHLGK